MGVRKFFSKIDIPGTWYCTGTCTWYCTGTCTWYCTGTWYASKQKIFTRDLLASKPKIFCFLSIFDEDDPARPTGGDRT